MNNNLIILYILFYIIFISIHNIAHAFSKYIISKLGLDMSKNHFIAGLKLSGREACYKLLHSQMENAISKYKSIWESKKEGGIKELTDDEKT